MHITSLIVAFLMMTPWPLVTACWPFVPKPIPDLTISTELGTLQFYRSEQRGEIFCRDDSRFIDNVDLEDFTGQPMFDGHVKIFIAACCCPDTVYMRVVHQLGSYAAAANEAMSAGKIQRWPRLFQGNPSNTPFPEIPVYSFSKDATSPDELTLVTSSEKIDLRNIAHKSNLFVPVWKSLNDQAEGEVVYFESIWSLLHRAVPVYGMIPFLLSYANTMNNQAGLGTIIRDVSFPFRSTTTVYFDRSFLKFEKSGIESRGFFSHDSECAVCLELLWATREDQQTVRGGSSQTTSYCSRWFSCCFRRLGPQASMQGSHLTIPQKHVRGLPCGHAFHDSCIAAFIHEVCPTCRKNFDQKDIQSLGDVYPTGSPDGGSLFSI